MDKIEVKNITKIFGPHPSKALELLKKGKSKEEILEVTGNTIGVNQASFSVKQGEFFVIMGLSGSGKSTLIRLINRLIEPTAGEVFIDGENITVMNKEQIMYTRRNKLGMVFQKFALFPHRTVLSNIEYGLEIKGIKKEESKKKAQTAIESVGLKGYENQYPDQLSGGMQQRVGLARALANETDILLMDEAFSALDPLIKREMQDELLELQDKLHKTILFITHDLNEALKLGDRIAIMKDGVIVQIGTAEEILKNPANEYVSSFVENVDRSKVLVASNVMKKPDIVTTIKGGPHVAIRKMQENSISSIFVVGEKKKLKGILTIENAVKAHEKNKPIEELLSQDYHTTSPDTPLQDLIEIATNTKFPIAVVENEKLLGILIRVTILSGLILGKDSNGFTEEEE